MSTFGKPQRRRADDDQRVLPLINVVFLLLIFFMIAGRIAHTDPIKVEPPVSDSEKRTNQRTLKVMLGADGDIRVGGTAVPLADVTRRLRETLSERGRKIVHLKADSGAEALAVIDVLGRIQAAGAEQVKLLTTKRLAP